MTTQLTDDDYDALNRLAAADRAKQAAPAQDDKALLAEMEKAYNINIGRESVCPMRAVLAVVRAHDDAAKQAPPEQAAIGAAAERLVRCKGRYHTEQNMIALAALFGVKLPPAEATKQAAQPVAWLSKNSQGDDIAIAESNLRERQPDYVRESWKNAIPLYASPLPPAAQAPQALLAKKDLQIRSMMKVIDLQAMEIVALRKINNES